MEHQAEDIELNDKELSSDSNCEESDIDSDETITYDEQSYVRCTAHVNSEGGFSFLEKTSKMYRKILSKNNVAVKNLLKNELSEIIDDDTILNELKQCKTENPSDRKLTPPQRFSIKLPPLPSGRNVRTEDLKIAFSRLERRKMDTLYQMNKQYEILVHLQNDFVTLTRQSLHIKKELNTQETLQNLNADQNILRKIRMQVNKVEQIIDRESDGVSKIMSKQDDSTICIYQNNPNNYVAKSSTSKDTLQARFDPVKIDCSMDTNDTAEIDISTEGSGNLETQNGSSGSSAKEDSMVTDEVTVDVPNDGNEFVTNSADSIKTEENMDYQETDDVNVTEEMNDSKDTLIDDKKENVDDMDITDYWSDGQESSADDVQLLSPVVFKRFKCSLCGKRYVDKRSYKSHLDVHVGLVLKCDKCSSSRTFKNSQSFNQHSKWHERGGVLSV